MPEQPHSSQRAAELLKDGRREAFAELYDNYSPALFGVILRILHSDQLAEEALQDAFVKIWKNAASYDEKKGRPFTWMLQIARNTAIDYTRTSRYQQGKKTDSLSYNVYEGDAHRVDPEIEDIGLRKVVETLDTKYRTLIELVYFKGYTQSDIEKELDIPLGTIKTRLRKAITELRAALQSEGFGLMSLWILLLVTLISLIA